VAVACIFQELFINRFGDQPFVIVGRLHVPPEAANSLHPREILILRLPAWTPRINIKISDSRRVTTSAKGKTGTYRRNAPRLPSIRTPRKIAR
jgi:hypothetical protein